MDFFFRLHNMNDRKNERIVVETKNVGICVSICPHSIVSFIWEKACGSGIHNF